MNVHLPARGRRLGGALLPVVLAAVLFVVAWKAVVVIGGYPTFILPPPEMVAARLVEAWVEGTMTPHALATLSEIGWGLLVGATSAIVVGYLLARSTLAERLFSPYLVAAQATPMAAIVTRVANINGMSNRLPRARLMR